MPLPEENLRVRLRASSLNLNDGDYVAAPNWVSEGSIADLEFNWPLHETIPAQSPVFKTNISPLGKPAVYFNGDNQIQNTDTGYPLQFLTESNGFTFSILLRWNGYSNDFQFEYLFKTSGIDGNGIGFYLVTIIGDNGTNPVILIGAAVADNSNPTPYIGGVETIDISFDQDYLLEVTWKPGDPGGDTKMYLDGVLIASGNTGSATSVGYTSNPGIGGVGNINMRSNVHIYEIAIWEGLLTEEQQIVKNSYFTEEYLVGPPIFNQQQFKEIKTKWQFFYIGTDTTGQIIAKTAVDRIIGEFSTERTVGNELYLEVGEITLEMLDEIEINEIADFNWLALYYKGSIREVYALPWTFESRNEKKPVRYGMRLYPIQKKFFDDAKVNLAEYDSGDAEKWSPAGSGIEVDINGVDFGVDDSRWGFSLGDALDNLSGSNYDGYRLTGVTHPIDSFGEGNLAVMYRGISFDFGTGTEEGNWNFTFNNVAVETSIYWYDFLLLAAWLSDSVIFVQPAVLDIGGNDFLTVSLIYQTRSNAPVGSEFSRWIERTFVRDMYRIDGLVISGADGYEFVLGDREGASVRTGSIAKFKGAALATPNADDTISIALGNPTTGPPITAYTILDGSNDNMDFFTHVNSLYTNVFNRQNGYVGRIKYDNHELLDDIKIDIDSFVRIYTMRLEKTSNFAEVEGPTADD